MENIEETIEYLRNIGVENQKKTEILDTLLEGGQAALLETWKSKASEEYRQGRTRQRLTRVVEMVDTISRMCYQKDSASPETLIKIVKSVRREARAALRELVPIMGNLDWSIGQGVGKKYAELGEIINDAISHGLLKDPNDED